jgi:hypothetical protein
VRSSSSLARLATHDSIAAVTAPDRDPRNVFHREPLVVPQLFVDLTPPWYRRPPAIVLAAVFVLLAVTIGALVARFGVAGVLRAYARLFR